MEPQKPDLSRWKESLRRSLVRGPCEVGGRARSGPVDVAEKSGREVGGSSQQGGVLSRGQAR